MAAAMGWAQKGTPKRARDRALAGLSFRRYNPSIAMNKTTLESGAFLAEVGNDVLCLNVNANKNPILKVGCAPICSRVILCKAGLNYCAIGRKT